VGHNRNSGALANNLTAHNKFWISKNASWERYIRVNSANVSAECYFAQKPHANLPDTPVAFTGASEYFQMLSGLPGGCQCALGLCKRIHRYFWMHLQLWRCIQDATRLTIWIFEFWSCWDLRAGLQEAFRADETSAQALWETWCQLLTAVVLRQKWFLLSSGS